MATQTTATFVGTNQFLISFPFLDPTHIEVKLNNVVKVLDVDYRLDTAPSSVVFLSPVTLVNGDVIVITRITQTATPMVDWPSQTAIGGSGLDTTTKQPIYAIEEHRDRAGEALAQEVIDRDAALAQEVIDRDAAVTAETNRAIAAELTKEPLLRDSSVGQRSAFSPPTNTPASHGDIIWSSIPFVNSPLGWVCYSSSPGPVTLWRSFGSGP